MLDLKFTAQVRAERNFEFFTLYFLFFYVIMLYGYEIAV